MRDAKIRKQESGSSAYEYKSTMNNSKQTRRMKTPKKNTKESWVFNGYKLLSGTKNNMLIKM